MELLRIGMDARLLMNRRGIGNFVYNLLAAIAELSESYQFILYVDDLKAAQFAPTGPHFVVKVLGPKIYPFWEQVSLPLAVARDHLDVLHCPANTAPLVLPSCTKLVLTIHDVMYLLPTSILPASPSAYQRLGRLYYRLITSAVAQRATALVTVSYHSRNDIVKYLGVDENQVQVVGEAPNSVCQLITDMVVLDHVKKKYCLERPVILALAHIDPRKNTARVIEAFALFAQGFPLAYQLVLVGIPLFAQSFFLKQAQELGVSEQVSFIGFVPEEDLVALYNLAEVFLYPSLYEGFGLPILEAMACGTPVVTSRAGSIPEVAGDAVLWVDPYSVESISLGMIELVTNKQLAQYLRAAGLEQAKRFSWQRTASEMLQIYEEAVA